MTIEGERPGHRREREAREDLAGGIPADPNMVQVTKGAGNDVDITVKRAGASKLKIAFKGVVRARRQGVEARRGPRR